MDIKEARRLTQEAKAKIEANRIAREEEERKEIEAEKIRLQKLEETTINEFENLIEKQAKKGENQCSITIYNFGIALNVKKFFTEKEYNVSIFEEIEYEGYESYRTYKTIIYW